MRVHPFPFRTRKLSSFVPTILGGKLPGKIGRCWHSYPSCIYCGTDNLLFIPDVMMISIRFAAVDLFRLILVPCSVSFDSDLLFMSLFHQDLIFPWFSLPPIDFSCFHLIYYWFTLELPLFCPWLPLVLPLTSTWITLVLSLTSTCFAFEFFLIVLISHHNVYIPP